MTKIIKSGLHNIKWILNDGKIIGALHGTTFMSRGDIAENPHVLRHYHEYHKSQTKKEKKHGKRTTRNGKRFS